MYRAQWLLIRRCYNRIIPIRADHEPAWWAALSAVVIAAIAVIFLRRRPLAFVLALGLFAVALGFAVATIKATLIDHPILRFPACSVSVAGFVELRDESQKVRPLCAPARAY
jgi:competence protein ComEC